jgi:CubicO group peptidase (beta-lactamase class C family)
MLYTQWSLSQDLVKLDSLANALATKYHIKGMVMVGVKNNEVVFKKGYGKANETYAMTPETPIYIASNTKAFIGLALAQLIDKGQLSLEDPLIKYIDRSYFPKDIEIEQITIRDILSHSTGLSNDPITFRTSSSGEYPENLQELLNFTVYKGDATTLKKEFSYSNFGYLLGGMVIENITGIPWKKYLEDNVLAPLNLSSTEPYLPKGKNRQEMAVPYIFNKEKPLKMVKKDNTLHAAGGLVTNLDDVATWLTYHTGNSGSSLEFKNNYKAYFSSTLEVDESFGPIKVTGYGYGWYYGDFFGTPIVFHAGGFSGHNSFISYLPNENVGCFIFVNELTNLRLVALQLTFYYYSLYSNNDYFIKSMDIFKKKIQSVYDSYKSDELTPIDPKTQPLPIGTFKNNEYGTLTIIKNDNEYIINLGENLQSIAYRSDNDANFLVQFIPESTVTFSVIESEEGFKIKYDDYGFFYPVRQ